MHDGCIFFYNMAALAVAWVNMSMMRVQLDETAAHPSSGLGPIELMKAFAHAFIVVPPAAALCWCCCTARLIQCMFVTAHWRSAS